MRPQLKHSADAEQFLDDPQSASKIGRDLGARRKSGLKQSFGVSFGELRKTQAKPHARHAKRLRHCRSTGFPFIRPEAELRVRN